MIAPNFEYQIIMHACLFMLYHMSQNNENGQLAYDHARTITYWLLVLSNWKWKACNK